MLDGALIAEVWGCWLIWSSELGQQLRCNRYPAIRTHLSAPVKARSPVPATSDSNTPAQDRCCQRLEPQQWRHHPHAAAERLWQIQHRVHVQHRLGADGLARPVQLRTRPQKRTHRANKCRAGGSRTWPLQRGGRTVLRHLEQEWRNQHWLALHHPSQPSGLPVYHDTDAEPIDGQFILHICRQGWSQFGIVLTFRLQFLLLRKRAAARVRALATPQQHRRRVGCQEAAPGLETDSRFSR
jgi:hypothetical protein